MTVAQTISKLIKGDGSWNWLTMTETVNVGQLIAAAYDAELITSEEQDALLEELRYR